MEEADGSYFMSEMQHFDGAGRLSGVDNNRKHLPVSFGSACPSCRPKTDHLRELPFHLAGMTLRVQAERGT